METKNDGREDAEKEILKELLLKEEDVLSKLKDLVAKSKRFFMIEQASGNIIFSSGIKISNKNKISLLLVGRYFTSKLKIISNDGVSIADMSRLLGIPKTTLSKPLGTLISEGKIRKNENSEYHAVFHKIEETLNSIK